MKKIFALLLALVMLLGLVACGNKAPAADAPAADAPAANSELEGNLTYVSWMTKGEDQPLIDGFMAENPGVKVENRAMEGASYPVDLNTLCLGGDVPDVFLVQPTMFNDLIKNGYIAPITGLEGVDTQEANPAANNFLSRDGEVYGYAINGGAGYAFCYYNKAIFEEHNLSVPNTWEEFESLCQQIKDLGIDPLITPAGDTWNANYFAYNQHFAELNKYDSMADVEVALLKGEIKPSDIYGSKFRTMKKFYDNGWISEGGLSMGWETGAQFFVDGGAAMFCSGNWVPGSAPIQGAPDFQLGCFLIPGIPGDNGKCLDYMNFDRILVMSASSKNPEAAKALVEYFIREDVLSEYLTRQGLIGINISVPIDPVFEDAFAKLQSSDYLLDPSALLPDMPTGWNANMYQYSADVFSGADVDELLSKLDAEFDAVVSTVDTQAIIDSLS